MDDSTRSAGLREYLRVVRQQRLIIVPLTLLFTAAALVYSMRAEPVYRAEATLQFQEPSSEIDEIGGGLGSRLTSQERAAIGADRVTSPGIERLVRRDLRRRDLGASVSASEESRSNLVVIRVSAPTAKRAAAVANSYARQTRRLLRDEFREDVSTQLRTIRRDLDRIARLPEPVVVADQLELRAKLRALRRLGEPVLIARTAKVPSSPVSPRPLRNTLLGFVVGLTVGLLAAFVRDSLDRRLRDSRDIADAASLPLLGRLREESMGRGPRGRNGATELDLEGVRILRANLEFLDVDRVPSRVVVTSPLPEEGKSTVALSLAVATALAGKRTLLLECDLRRPVLAKRLHLDATPGLTDYLADHATYEEIARPVELPYASSLNGSSNGSGPERVLDCITAGSSAPRPAELLGSQRFKDFFGTISRAYDTVVIDTSPLLPVADTLELVPHADRVVVCVRAGRTTREQLRAAREALGRLPGPPAGVMVTGIGKGEELDYGYYSYGSPGRVRRSVGV